MPGFHKVTDRGYLETFRPKRRQKLPVGNIRQKWRFKPVFGRLRARNDGLKILCLFCPTLLTR